MAAEDYFDPYGEDDEQPSLVECKRCGKGGLQWEDDNGRWVLLEHNGKVHQCNLQRVAACDFEALP